MYRGGGNNDTNDNGDYNLNEGDDDCDYGDVLEAANSSMTDKTDALPLMEEYEEEEEEQQQQQQQQQSRHLTLLQLTEGNNKEAAKQEILNKIYNFAVVCNFIALKLVNSSGGTNPSIYSSENASFITNHPELKIPLTGPYRSPIVANNAQSKRTNNNNDDMSLETLK